MTRTSRTATADKIAVWALTPGGAALAARLAAALPGVEVLLPAPLAPLAPAAVPFASLKTALAERFRAYRGHVCVMATGIVVRLLAGLLVHKAEDPAVVVVDEGGGFAISLVSGHLGGANALARQVAAVLGARPVITTATDVNGVPAVDVVALELGLAVENPEAIKAVNMALLAGEPIAVHDPGGLLTGRVPGAVPGGTVAVRARVWVEDRTLAPPAGALVLRPRSLVAGIGCNRHTGTEEMRELLLATLEAAGLARASLARLASIDLKADEPGLAGLAEELKLAVDYFSRADIRRVEDDVPTPSARVHHHIGVKSVCEAAAILASRSGTLIVPKRSSRNATVAVARIGSRS
jgi:cobalt-precorrin 5A hydrolase